VLGIVSVILLGFLSGVPAITLGAIALRKKHPGKGMAIVGVVTGSLGTLVTIIGVLYVVISVFLLRRAPFGPGNYPDYIP
jgi:Ca2+/Na+ antiporter